MRIPIVLMAVIAGLAMLWLPTEVNSVLAQDQIPPLSKVTVQPINPFVALKAYTIRGSQTDLLAGKKLPQWRNSREFVCQTAWKNDVSKNGKKKRSR